MDTFGAKKLDSSGIASIKVMLCRKLLQFCFYGRNYLPVLSDSREIGLMISYLTDLLEEEIGWDRIRDLIVQPVYSVSLP